MGRSNWHEKNTAGANVGAELRRRGWVLFGYKEDKSEMQTNYYDPASWSGVATHADYPGVVVVVNANEYIAKHSGQEQTRDRWVDIQCPACAGRGVEPDALTYEEAVKNPREAHKIKAETINGIRFAPMVGTFDPNYVSPKHYFDNGKPKCLRCNGSTIIKHRELEVVCIWPTFQANARGRFWHVERDGRIIASGTGYTKAASYGTTGSRATLALCDEIEAAARRTVQPTTSNTQEPQQAGNLCTVATGGTVTVRAEHEKGWTYIRLEPRVDRSQYDAFATRFGVKWHRMRRQPVLYRLVGADELAAFFGPVPGRQQTQEAPQPAPQAPVFFLVKKGHGSLWNEPNSGAEDIHIRQNYAVLQVEAAKASYLMGRIRSGMGHLSPTVYESLVAADADAPNHLPRQVTPAAPAPDPLDAVIDGAKKRAFIFAPQIEPLIERYQRRDLPNDPAVSRQLQEYGTRIVPQVRLQEAIEVAICACNSTPDEFDRYVRSLFAENRARLDAPTQERQRVSSPDEPAVARAFQDDQAKVAQVQAEAEVPAAPEPADVPDVAQPAVQIEAEAEAEAEARDPDAPGGGRTHLVFEFHDADWTTGPKAKKAAQARADYLYHKGWSVKAPERRKGYYTLYVYDPNLAGDGGYVSKIGASGMVGYNEATGQEWKLYHRQRPADEAKIAQNAVWSETPVPITPSAPEPAPTPEPMPEPAVQPTVAAKPQQLSLF